jgi:hypothetical protein
MEKNMATYNEEEKYFDLTRKQAIDLADTLCQETDENHKPGSGTYSEYIETLKKGQEALKTQARYYPYLPKENEL